MTYTGREQDRDSRFYYYRTRYYNSRIGRFTSVDKLIREVERVKEEEGMEFGICGGYVKVREEMGIGEEELIPEIERPELPERKYQQPYVYVENNPVNEIDPEGKGCCNIKILREIMKDIMKTIRPNWKNVAYHFGKKGMKYSSCITVLTNLVRMQNYLKNNCPSGIGIPFSFNSLKTSYEFGLNCCKSASFHFFNPDGSKLCWKIEWFRYIW